MHALDVSKMYTSQINGKDVFSQFLYAKLPLFSNPVTYIVIETLCMYVFRIIKT